MNTLALRTQTAGTWAWLHAAWASLQRRELGWFVLVGLGYGLADVSGLMELPEGVPLLSVLSRDLLSPLLVSLMLIPFWLPAARSDPAHPQRPWRLAAAAAAGSVVAMAVLWPLVRVLDWHSVSDHMRILRGQAPFSAWHWSQFAGDVLSVFVPALLAFALFDALARRAQRRAQLQQALHDQARLAREALSARLAALQAQVEPQFLFDALVEIEQAYAAHDAEAPARLERLIQHLRVALPRLRDGATTLATETELLQTWLDVARDRWPDTPALQVHHPAALAPAPLPPMLLLPLLQAVLATARGRAVRLNLHLHLHAHTLPAGGLRVQLTLEGLDLCPPAELLRTLAERAQSLVGTPVRLWCETDGGSSASDTGNGIDNRADTGPDTGSAQTRLLLELEPTPTGTHGP